VSCIACVCTNLRHQVAADHHRVRARHEQLELLDVEPAGELLDGADYPPAPERAELAEERDGDLLQAEHELRRVALPAERLQVRMRMQMMRGCGYMRECEMKL